MDQAPHPRTLRPGPARRTSPGFRARLRSDRALHSSPLGGRRALPTHAAMAEGQEARGGGQSRGSTPLTDAWRLAFYEVLRGSPRFYEVLRVLPEPRRT